MTNHLLKTLVALSFAGLTAVGCTKAPKFEVIPRPAEVELQDGVFKVAGAAFKVDSLLDEGSLKCIDAFAEKLHIVTGRETKADENATKHYIEFKFNANLAEEEYFLDITKDYAVIQASAEAGFRYAIQTVGQMLPAAFYGNTVAKGVKWVIPCASIKDKPRFAYRGMHLDVARHFFNVDEVKRYLDVMAAYKLNRFHWHLTEDQGWRIEIKKYPKLTEIGSVRPETLVGHYHQSDEYDGTPYGGFYTQDEIREVVAHAEKLGITVIPEIDLPGHMVAALASYPELGCTGGPYTVRTTWGVSEEVLCPGKETTFKFIEGVLDEVMDLFPSEYIHIGGDECPKTAWSKCPECQKRIKALGLKSDGNHTAEQYLQNYVTARVQKYLNDHGRKIIGWDEILEGELAPGATVMSWRGATGGIEAAKKGFDVIMTPNTYLYFDYYQSDSTSLEPLALGGYLPVETVYSCDPCADIPEEAQSHVLGVQANLWTEYIATPEHLEYMLLPRMAALSEVQWRQPEAKDFEEFKSSLPHAFEIYDAMGLNYSKAAFGTFGMWK